MVVLRRRNMVPEMNVPFSVTYNFPPTAMLRKPLLLVAGALGRRGCTAGGWPRGPG